MARAYTGHVYRIDREPIRLTRRGKVLGVLVMTVTALSIGIFVPWDAMPWNSMPDITCSTSDVRPLPAYTVACSGYEQDERERVQTHQWASTLENANCTFTMSASGDVWANDCTDAQAEGDPASALIEEDDPRWDCATMGNRICGPKR